MKKYSLIIILALFSISGSYAQGGRFREKKEQIKSMKIAFITDKLDLTTTEAEKFWPLYNAFDEKQRDLRQEKMRAYMDRIDDATVDKMSEKDASGFLSKMESTEDDLYQSRKKFISSLKGILPSVKIIKLKKAEEDFNRKLLKQYRDKNSKK